MKKNTLYSLVLLLYFNTGALAQAELTGSRYLQNFDRIEQGLPEGWQVSTQATSTHSGVQESFQGTPSTWSSTAAGFKNYASAATTPFSTAAADQHAATDRALGARQGGTGGYDPGAAIIFRFKNPGGLTNFRLSFSFQCLTAESRTCEWTADYGTGDTPTVFIPLHLGSNLITGNNLTYCDTVYASFDQALDHLNETIWIRITTLTPSAGTGRRAAVAIDNFMLEWDGSAPGPMQPVITEKNPIDGSLYVPPETIPWIRFSRIISKGNHGTVRLTNENLAVTDTISVTDSLILIKGDTVFFNALKLAPASTYHIQFDSVCFDTAGFSSKGIYSPTEWRFSTAPEVKTLYALQETFDAACMEAQLPEGWSSINKTGNQEWKCHTAYGITSMRISAYSGGRYRENEDWLLTPAIDIAAYESAVLHFRLYRKRNGPPPEILLSHDYKGYGDPENAVWEGIRFAFNPEDTVKWVSESADISAFISRTFFLAFRYTSSDTDGYEVRVDSIVITPLHTGNRLYAAPEDQFYITSVPGYKAMYISYTLPPGRNISIRIHDLSGRLVDMLSFSTTVLRYEYIRLPDVLPGLYILALQYDSGVLQQKILVH